MSAGDALVTMAMGDYIVNPLNKPVISFTFSQIVVVLFVAPTINTKTLIY